MFFQRSKREITGKRNVEDIKHDNTSGTFTDGIPENQQVPPFDITKVDNSNMLNNLRANSVKLESEEDENKASPPNEQS